jgi:hypothetical protein
MKPRLISSSTNLRLPLEEIGIVACYRKILESLKVKARIIANNNPRK